MFSGPGSAFGRLAWDVLRQPADWPDRAGACRPARVHGRERFGRHHLDLVGSLLLGGGVLSRGAGGERRHDRPWSVVVAVPRARAAACGVRRWERRTVFTGDMRQMLSALTSRSCSDVNCKIDGGGEWSSGAAAQQLDERPGILDYDRG